MSDKTQPTRPGQRTVYLNAEPFTYELMDATGDGYPGMWAGRLQYNGKEITTQAYKRPANVDAAMLRLIAVNVKLARDAEHERRRLEQWNKGEPRRYAQD